MGLTVINGSAIYQQLDKFFSNCFLDLLDFSSFEATFSVSFFRFTLFCLFSAFSLLFNLVIKIKYIEAGGGNLHVNGQSYMASLAGFVG
jgi:hypothetical protein